MDAARAAAAASAVEDMAVEDKKRERGAEREQKRWAGYGGLGYLRLSLG